ncbi:MAG: NAD(P)/FAD-dependent oxidoreductase [Actinomycetota bacterium]
MTLPDEDQADLIAAAVEAADLRPLVLALFHHTGDDRWLREPFLPRRDVRLIADPAAGFEPAVQAEIKAEARRVFAGGAAPVVDDPGRDRFHEMINIFLGEQVPEEYVQLMREDMGFEDGDARWGDAVAPADCPDVVIVGTGVFGLCLAAKLDALGVPFTMLDRNTEVGGTWLNNRYPGCGVDTPNHFYSYSFAPNPGWRHYFSPRDELQAYVEQCATDFGVRDRIRFGRRLTAARWNESLRRWKLTAELVDGSSEEFDARVLVAATGHFDQPVNVAFAGLEDFGGEVHHTAQWPTGVELAGRRVGVIGTGASAMQVVPTVAGDVSALTIFQRTAQWARPVPEYDAPVDPAGQWLFEHVPHYARWYRFGLFWRYGDGLLRFLRKDPEWPHPDRALNRTNDRHRQEMTEFIEESLASKPELIPHCVPDYPPFGKRILIDNGGSRRSANPMSTSSPRRSSGSSPIASERSMGGCTNSTSWSWRPGSTSPTSPLESTSWGVTGHGWPTTGPTTTPPPISG